MRGVYAGIILAAKTVAETHGERHWGPTHHTDHGALLDDNGDSVMGIPQEKLDETLALAAEKIPKSVVAIYRFW